MLFVLLQTGREAHPACCTKGAAFFSGFKRPVSGADHPTFSRADVTNGLEIYSGSLLCLHNAKHGVTFTFIYIYIYIYIYIRGCFVSVDQNSINSIRLQTYLESVLWIYRNFVDYEMNLILLQPVFCAALT
jgi:hypothetical protein